VTIAFAKKWAQPKKWKQFVGGAPLLAKNIKKVDLGSKWMEEKLVVEMINLLLKRMGWSQLRLKNTGVD